MFRQKRMRFLSLAVFLALFVAAIMPLSALAQDEVPPQPEVPAVVEEEPVADEPGVEEQAAEEPAEEAAIPEILEQLPEGTELVVVDEAGEALPLVSTEAAETLAAPDPFFTVGGTTYRFFGAAGACGGAPNCWDGSVNPIQDAINYLNGTTAGSPWSGVGTSPTDGNIYVETGIFNEDVLVDGSVWNTTPDYLGIIGAGSGLTVLNGSFSIIDMNAFTLSGFTVYKSHLGGAVSVSGNNGDLLLKDLDVTSEDIEVSAIDVYDHSGDVTLKDVTSTALGGAAARISMKEGTSGDIVINGGDFSDSWEGIIANAFNGNVTLNDVTATGNHWAGAFLVSENGNITVNGGNFSDNGDSGVITYLSGSGVVTLKNVIADGNDYYGAYVSSEGNSNILCGKYTGNGQYGLYLYLSGDHNAHLGGPVLTGNTDGEYFLDHGTVSFGECPKPVEPVTPQNEGGGGKHGFKPQNNLPGDPPVCNGEKMVSLEPGDGFGVYQNLCGVNFQLEEVTNNILPGALPTGASYITGMNTDISMAGKAVTVLPVGGKIKLRFPIPAGVDEASLAVLFWNGTAWVEVPGGEVVDGFYEVEINEPGNYVLASQ